MHKDYSQSLDLRNSALYKIFENQVETLQKLIFM